MFCSHGEPGLLALEYFYDALKKEKVSSVDVGALTDYDPWGFKIAENFGLKLKASIFFGASKVRLKALDASQIRIPDLHKVLTTRYDKDTLLPRRPSC